VTSFRVLGPVAAWSGECRLVPDGRQQVKPLAVLSLGANRAISADTVIDGGVEVRAQRCGQAPADGGVAAAPCAGAVGRAGRVAVADGQWRYLLEVGPDETTDRAPRSQPG
jgi:hypothetical protein